MQSSRNPLILLVVRGVYQIGAGLRPRKLMSYPDPETLLRHATFVRSVARKLVGDEHHADDVQQQTWLKALEHPPSGRLSSWLGTVTRNLALKLRRGERRRARRERTVARPEALSPEPTPAERDEVFGSLANALLRLPEPHRTVIFLRFYEAVPPREIARRLDIPLATVKSRLRRASELLRHELDREYRGDRQTWRLALLPMALPAQATATSAVATAELTAGAILVKTKIAIAATILTVGSVTVWHAAREPVHDVTTPTESKSAPTHSAEAERDAAAPASVEGRLIDTRRFVPAPDDRTLLVRVVDHNRKPQPGIPVALKSLDDRRRGAYCRAMTGSDGSPARLRLGEILIRDTKEVKVTFDFLGVDLPEVPINLEALPREPVTLLLPPTGAAEIAIVDPAGSAFCPSDANLRIRWRKARQDDAPWPRRPRHRPGIPQDGVVRLPIIEVGLELLVEVIPLGTQNPVAPARVVARGPDRIGETRRIEVTYGDATYPIVTGRLLREDGTPWPARELEARAILEPRPDRVTLVPVSVAPGGRFRLVVRHPCPPGGRRVYEIFDRVRPGGAALHRVQTDLSRPLRQGETDLGDLVLGRGTLLVAGSVVDRNGEPVAGLRLSVLREDPLAGNFSGMNRLLGHRTQEDGTFAIYLQSGEIALDRQYILGVRADPKPRFRAGDRNLSVVYIGKTTGSIKGSIKLVPGVDPGDYKITVVLDRGRYFSTRAHDDGAFRLTSLPAGTWPVLVQSSSAEVRSEEALQRFERVVVKPGEINRDPRLQNLVVPRGGLSAFTLTVVDEKGRPVQVRIGVGEGKKTSYRVSRNGIVRITTLRPAVDVSIQADGHRTVRLKGVSADRKVTLRMGLKVRFTTRALAGGNNPLWRLGLFFGKGAVPEEHGSIESKARPFTRHGELDVLLPGLGIYRPTVCLIEHRKGESVSHPLVGVNPVNIDVVDQDARQYFEINVPEQLLLSVIDKARREGR